MLGGMRVVALSNIGTIFNKIKSAVFKLCRFSISEGFPRLYAGRLISVARLYNTYISLLNQYILSRLLCLPLHSLCQNQN